MGPVREKIIETVTEVMSQRQFQYADKNHQGFNFDLPPVLGYLILALIMGVALFFLLLFLKEVFFRTEKKIPKKPEEKKLEGEVATYSTQIAKLHAEILNQLKNRKVVTLKKWKTNADYIEECKLPFFGKVCSLYDSVVYGSKDVSRESIVFLAEEFSVWRDEHE